MTSEFKTYSILLVDDEPALLRSVENVLRNAGFDQVTTCSDSRKARGLLDSLSVDLLVLDLSMPHVTGQEILSWVSTHHPDIPVLVVTAGTEVETAVECMKRGAYDYLLKPVDSHRLLAAISCGLEMRALRAENHHLKTRLLAGELEHPEHFASIVTGNEAMFSIFRYVEAVAKSPQPVLITGETGVGKELIARAVHDASGLAGAFVAVNTASLDDNMFSDTFFGHAKGAYTGADSIRGGLVEKAQGGTLFMDEIGDLNMASQVKLLRLIQEREYFPVGSDTARHTDARVVVSTNRNLKAMLQAGAFREDLYYRIIAHQIRIPPLRERRGDLPLLLDHFLKEASETLGKTKPSTPVELVSHLATHEFPGNVRELRAMVHDAVSNHSGGVLALTQFLRHIDAHRELERQKGGGSGGLVFPARLPTLREMTLLLTQEALTRAGNNQTAAARLLGLSRQSLNKYAQQIQEPEDDGSKAE